MPLTMSTADREILRRLAARVGEIAALPEQSAKIKLWVDHNRLRDTRPLVIADPEGAWGELVPDSVLLCKDPLARSWEQNLRERIFRHEHIGDDWPIDAFLNIPWKIETDMYGVPVNYSHGTDRGSYVWDFPIKDLSTDIDKLKFRTLNVNREETRAQLALAQETFGTLLTSRIYGTPFWTMGLTIDLIRLIGLENLMVFMLTEPDNMHRLMTFMRDDWMRYILWIEAEGLLTPNNGSHAIASGGIGCTDELPQKDYDPAKPARLKDLWGFGESQETVSVAPEHFEEFILPYQLPLMDKFGLLCYGCCEGLHLRIDPLLKIPRLRRVSVSPWADQPIMAEKLGKNIIYSRKPNPALVSVGFLEDAIRQELRETLAVTKKSHVEFVLKDTHTVENDVSRIGRWVKIAYDEIHKAGY